MTAGTLTAVLRSLALVAAAAPLAAAADDLPEPPPFDAREFEFRVLLDGKEIGSHHYNVRSSGGKQLVDARARFDVKILFINAYRYRHSLSSRWEGDCLESLEADTNANGEKLSVRGKLRAEDFVVKLGGDTKSLPSCVMNFAYWNPLILDQQKLLNPQTGEYLEVDVERTEERQVDIDGRTLTADSYRIRARNMRIDLWYSQESGQWVALESLTKEGRTIRYELVRGWVTEIEVERNG